MKERKQKAGRQSVGEKSLGKMASMRKAIKNDQDMI